MLCDRVESEMLPIGARAIVVAGLTLALATSAATQGNPPWTVVMTPNANPLRVAECSPVRIELTDPVSKAVPRGPRGAYISIADFDLTATGPRDGIAVGRYDGASAWSACACPGAAGSNVTITATYPARSLAPAARVPEVAFQTSITVPVVAGRSSAVPIGCEVAKTTTVSTAAARPAATATTTAGDPWPWTVTIIPSLHEIPVGSCSPISIDLRDATGKKEPRNPAGSRIALGDFDMSVTPAQSGAAVVRADGANAWSVCGCGSPGSSATITATYPGRALPDASRVSGVAFQSSTTVVLGAPKAAGLPSVCGAPASPSLSSAAASGTLAPPTGVVPPPSGTTVAGPAAASRAAGSAITGGAATRAPAPAYTPGPVTVTLGMSANGSWYTPGPVSVNLGITAHGEWYLPAPVTVTFDLSATGRWIEAPEGALRAPIAPVKP